MKTPLEQQTVFRRFFEYTLDLVSVIDAEGNFRYASPSYVEALGLAPEELVGTSALALVHPDDLPMVVERLASIQPQPDAQEIVEVRYRHRDGQWRYLEARARNLLHDPEIRGILVNARDVTERVQAQQELQAIRAQQEVRIAARTAALTDAEAELQEREKLFRLLFKNNPLPMWVFDEETLRFLEVNDAAVAQYGYTHAEFLQMGILDIRPSDDAVALERYMHSERPALRPHTQWRHQRRDGSVIYVDIASHELHYQNRPAVLVVATDITERLQAEEEARRLLTQEREARASAHRARQRLEFLFQSMSAMLVHGGDYAASLRKLAEAVVPELADWCAVDVVEDGQIVRLAAAHRDPEKAELIAELQRHYSPTPDSPVGLPNVLRTGETECYPEMPPALLARITQDEKHFRLVQALGVGSVLVVPLIARENVLGALTLVTADAGHPFGAEDIELAEDLARRAAILIDNARLFRDTELANAQLEGRVTERTAQLEAANQELESFAYSVSHDLRSPLRAIEGFSKILIEHTENGLSEKTRDYLQRIRRNALRMGMLIDDLLQFSRLSRKEMRKQTVQTAEIVQQVITDLEPVQEGRRIEWSLHDLPACQADRSLLIQVFTNLIDNALKFTQQRDVARIEIGVRHECGRTVYYVADNGAGFDMRYAGQLFGVFQRLHLAEEYEGTGVGLAIVQRIIHRHGGAVWAEAEIDHGATFFFTLDNLSDHDEPPD